MSRKYNVKHNRSKSKYPERLAARGKTSASVRMRVLTERDTFKLLHPEKETNIETCQEIPTLGSNDTVSENPDITNVLDATNPWECDDHDEYDCAICADRIE